MRYVVATPAEIQSIKTHVDTALGYPKFGVDAETGEPILPAPGQPIETVRGVSLCWADALVHPTDPNLAAYQYDAKTGPILSVFVPHLEAIELGTDWFPEL